MEHYVTLFDRLFLPQGLALHSSLQRHSKEPFVLWVLCMDEHTKSTIDRLRLPNARTIALAEVETESLRTVKPGRTNVEYCWTLTPFTPTMVFERASDARRVTYLDADMYFLKSPGGIFEEFEASGKSALITEHAYDAEYDQAAISGRFCVQFVTFRRESSDPIVEWWKSRCLEWCFNRVEDGKLGDQKYLDEWPSRFPDLVHVLRQTELLLGPWNARRFPYSNAVAWHFHGLRLLKGRKVLLHGPYAIPDVVHRGVYMPYVEELSRSLEMIDEEIVQMRRPRRSTLLAKSLCHVIGKKWREIRGYRPIRRLPSG